MKKVQYNTGFTMIELIFVIVILGILAAVALPKFAGISGQAEEATVTAFAGTLNRTVGPMMWSTSISEHNGGSIKSDANSAKFNGEFLINYVDNYPNLLDAGSVDFDKCRDGIGVAQPFMKKVGQGNLNLFCKDGDQSESPRFEASEDLTYTF